MTGRIWSADKTVKLGVGIITYNRVDRLQEVVTSVRLNTTMPFELCVADDGSTDGTADAMRRLQVPTITGVNMGSAWNRNRALFYLMMKRNCDIIILFEDDTKPSEPGWQRDWVRATQQWGHVNFAPYWIQDTIEFGKGTVDEPALGRKFTAQCSAFSREALAFVGFMDLRFKGAGFEHVDHTFRLARLHYGVRRDMVAGDERFLYLQLSTGIVVSQGPTNFSPENGAREEALFHRIMFEDVYRMPWRNEAELLQLRQEIAAA